MSTRSTQRQVLAAAAKELHKLFTAVKSEQNGGVNSNAHEEYIYRILAPKDLLRDASLKHIIKQLASMSCLSSRDFTLYYQTTIDHYAQFVQALPFRADSVLGGLLKLGLARALLAVQVIYDEAQQAANPRRLFAAFSASLLQTLHRVFRYAQVFVCDEKGEVVAPWNPVIGPMSDHGYYYRLFYYVDEVVDLPKHLVMLLVHHILTEEVLQWLMEDRLVFREWLVALTQEDDEEGAGGLRHVIALVKQRLEDAEEWLQVMSAIKVPKQHDQQHAPVYEILHWLQQDLTDNTLPINRKGSWVHYTVQGLFLIYPFLFDRFIGRYGHRYDFVYLVHLASKMGLIKQAQDQQHLELLANLPSAVKPYVSVMKIQGEWQPGILISSPQLLLPREILIARHEPVLR